MKKIILSIVISTITVSVFGQIKVFSDGKSSIGSTVSPSNFSLGHLVVAGSTGFLSTSASSPTSSPMIKGNNSYSTASAPDFTWVGNTNTGFFHPASNTMAFSINGTEQMRFFSTGNISIGNTSNWGAKLAVHTGHAVAFASYVNHTSDWDYANIIYVNRANTKALTVSYNSGDAFNVYGSGYVEATDYLTWSDLTLKENITPIQNALDKIIQLNGVMYNYKQNQLSPNAIANTVINSDPPRKHLGLIAQEVELILPEIVTTNEKGLKGIAYQNLISLLIEGMKEQQQQIVALQEQIDQCCQKDDAKLRTGNEEPTDVNMPKQGTSYLLQNRPNPFNEQTTIEYFITENVTDAAIMVFDLNGKLMVNEPIKTTGKGSVVISGNKLNPGMYYYSLVIKGEEVETKKMIYSVK